MEVTKDEFERKELLAFLHSMFGSINYEFTKDGSLYIQHVPCEKDNCDVDERMVKLFGRPITISDMLYYKIDRSMVSDYIGESKNDCQFWLGNDVLCGTKEFVLLAMLKKGTEMDSLIPEFVSSLVTSQAEHSLDGFMQHVDTFTSAQQPPLLSSDLLRHIHENYKRHDGFMHYIGADYLLWFLTHVLYEMPGPSLAIQYSAKKGSDRALKMFMDVKYIPAYGRDHFVIKWSPNALYFGEKFNEALPEGLLPRDLKVLDVGDSYDHPLKKNVLPTKLQVLRLGTKFKQELTNLPTDLRELCLSTESPLSLHNGPQTIEKFGRNNTYSVSLLPKTLVKLVLGRNYKCPVSLLPETLVELVTGTLLMDKKYPLPKMLKVLDIDSFEGDIAKYDFLKELISLSVSILKQNLDVLPDTLESLDIGTFEGTLTVLPSKLESLVLRGFNDTLEKGVLPDSLVSLHLEAFNQDLTPNVFPDSLLSLKLGDFNKYIHKDLLPRELQSLELRAYNRTIYSLPSGLKSLELHNFDQQLKISLPPQLTSLKMHSYTKNLIFDTSVDYDEDDYEREIIVVLPLALVSLELGAYNHKLGTYYSHLGISNRFMEYIHYLPSSLRSLNLKKYNQRLSYLPPNLTSLNLEEFNFEQLELGCFPPDLESLTMGKYNLPLRQYVLPEKLESLTMGKYNLPLRQHILPKTLKSLILTEYDHVLPVLPEKLRILYLNSFDQTVEKGTFPPLLEHIISGSWLDDDVLPISLKSFEHVEIP